MQKQTDLHIRLELIWWLVTLLVVAGILLPIYTSQTVYPFWVSNVLFIVAFITMTRYIFLLRFTFLAYQQWLKVAVAILCIPLFLYMYKELNLFRVIEDQIGIEEMFEHLSLEGQTSMSSYVRTEMLFFGAASLIATAIMPFRMLISFWRTHNRGTV